MKSASRFNRCYLSFIVSAIIVSTAVFTPPTLNAQQLEEIIVTAQRRDQSLQEVPISLEVYSGADISMQGFKTMEDLAKYSPSVIIMDRSNRVNTTVRGFGTVAGSSQALVSSAPFFVDGIHLGATAMAKVAFLDTERVEVLKGPQPLHFGMNAVSGAFNITSRRPGPEWEADITAEVGNDASRSLTGGIGGPVTETLGIRMAGMYQGDEGPLRNMVSGEKYGGGENLGGRILLQWNPNDKIDVVTKFEVSRQRASNDLDVGCLAHGNTSDLRGFVDLPLDGDIVEDADFGSARGVLAPPPKGLSTTEGLALAWYPEEGEGRDCFGSEYGFSRGGPYLAPAYNIVEGSSRDPDDGMIDIRAAAGHVLDGGYDGNYSHTGTPNNGLVGQDDNDSKSALVDFTYRFDNGLSFNSQTGMIWFDSNSGEENCQCPFFTNGNARGMDLDQFSQNLRLTSRPEGYDLDFAGGTNLEFMFGLTYQEWQKDMYDNSNRATFRQGQRYNESWEDARWITGMWELTFNFMDNQLSVSVGGRLTNDRKKVFLMGGSAQWIFDEIPCDPAGGDPDPATCLADPNFKWINPDLTTRTSYDPSNPAQRLSAANIANRNIHGVRVDSPNIFLTDVDMDNLWTVWRWNGPSRVPLNYRGGATTAVGLTQQTWHERGGPFGDCDSCPVDPEMDTTDYNNQFVISYTPNALDGAHTFYGKYAEAFKGAVADTGQATIPPLSDMTMLPEYITAWEVGTRGNLFNNRVRYDISAFINDFKDVQLGAAGALSDPLAQNSVQLNAARQLVKGIEFGFTAAATQNLTLNFGGALMKGTMKQLDGGGCSADEIIAVAWDIVHNNGGQRGAPARTAEELAVAQDYVDRFDSVRSAALMARVGNLPDVFFINGGCRMVAGLDGTEFDEESMNRDGERAAYTPDWKFVLGVDYRLPVMDTYEIFVNAKGFVSDGWLTSSEIFDRASAYKVHADLNLMAGFGPQDGNWRVSAFLRNMFEVKPSFDPEYDLEYVGLFTAGQESETRGLGGSAWKSYGVRLEYLF